MQLEGGFTFSLVVGGFLGLIGGCTFTSSILRFHLIA